MKALVPSVLIIGALVGWFAPAAEPSAELAKTSPDEPAAPHINVAAEPQWYGGEMVLDRAADGHFYAGVRIESRDVRMLVDTGASSLGSQYSPASRASSPVRAIMLAPVSTSKRTSRLSMRTPA